MASSAIKQELPSRCGCVPIRSTVQGMRWAFPSGYHINSRLYGSFDHFPGLARHRSGNQISRLTDTGLLLIVSQLSTLSPSAEITRP